MALMQLMAFVNTGVLIISFALLLIVLSFSVSQINSVALYANAASVASSLGIRMVSSPNCFAYKLSMNYYDNSSSAPGGPIYSVYDTEPGTINLGKFSEDSFLSCIQYMYFGGATNIPALTGSFAAVTGVSARLVDTQDPSNLGGTGSLFLSNYNQLNYGSKFLEVRNYMAHLATDAEYVAIPASVAISTAIGVATAGLLNVNLILAFGSNTPSSIAPQYSAADLFYGETTYTEKLPVTIQFVNEEDQPMFTNTGLLYVTVNYGISPFT